MLTSILLSLSVILGISGLYFILRNKEKLFGLPSSVFSIALASFLLIYWGQYNNRYALTAAIEKGNIQKIEELIAKGYDINAKSGNGYNMLTLCFFYKPTHHSDLNDNSKIYSMLELLINNGADVNALDEMDRSPLFLAAGNGKIPIAKMLIENGANVNLKCKLDRTALHEAAEQVNSKMVKILIENGANVNAVDISKENTPLLDAVETRKIENAKILIQSGASTDIKNYLGQTALDIAKEEGYTEIINLLKEHGAK